MDSFDYVIVGGGSSGSALGGRLADIPGHTICVLEAGPSDRTPFVQIPAGFLKLIFDPKYTWGFATEPGAHVGGRSIPMIQGRVLGGGSSVNGMIYTRGQSGDFDHWAQRGNQGWSYADVLPYFRRCERYAGGDDTYRGRGGKVAVTELAWRDRLTDAFIESAAAGGVPRNADYNGAVQDGVGRYQYTIEDGHRMSAARSFLWPAKARGQADVRVGARVAELVFEGRRVVGVRYRQDGSPELREVRANKEVILCAGAANSVKLLQLSGIGPGAVLSEFGIAVRHELPGVGANLQDHYVSRMVFGVKDAPTINRMARNLSVMGEAVKWLVRKPSMIGIGPIMGCVYWKSNPDLETADYVLTFTPGSYKAGEMGKLDSVAGMTFGAYQLRPESRGYVKLRSADFHDKPIIQPNYLSVETDQRVIVAALKKCRAIAHRMPLSRYYDGEVYPGPGVISDDDVLDYARAQGGSGYHISGTCRMGPEGDQYAVVDSSLRLRGFDNLRVADASVMPSITSGNTNAPTMMIAEKAADLILGKKLPAAIL